MIEAFIVPQGHHSEYWWLLYTPHVVGSMTFGLNGCVILF